MAHDRPRAPRGIRNIYSLRLCAGRVNAVQTRVGDRVRVPGEECGKVPVAQGEEVVQVAFAPADGGRNLVLGSASAGAL